MPSHTLALFLEASLVSYNQLNKPFKAAYHDHYNEWMASGSKSFTPAGNTRAPDKLLCLTWVKKVWASVSAEVIIKSFKTCGISVNTDGSEDAQVHCLKPEGMAAGALPTIAAETARLSGEAREELDEDPFTDIEELNENDIDDN